jgi:SpoVK/Ycf46/Vps4 family AAA+-type ATPase
VDRLTVERQRREHGLPTSGLTVPHIVFEGPPGTGKTTVAEALGEILHAMGLLRTGRVLTAIETDLVAQYVGHTGPRTRSVILNALGGVLFIDEAYRLGRRLAEGLHDFGREALDELAVQMERRRGQFVVVAAGYRDEMEAFLDSDPGFRGRFGLTVEFPGYSDAELVEILRRSVAADFEALGDDVAARATQWLRARRAKRGEKEFDNARAVRNLVDEMRNRQASRLARLVEPTVQALRTFVAEDVPDA